MRNGCRILDLLKVELARFHEGVNFACGRQRARNYFEPKYRFERCEKVRGICKTFCDDVEYDYGYCIKWRSQCCV
ncbi:beta-defensin 110-like [Macaca fascicularis]|uniref:beta-defensin 110-like n=1 Tax=Macaca fascicularis TaxID=9541 RepID=UPI0032B0605A